MSTTNECYIAAPRRSNDMSSRIRCAMCHPSACTTLVQLACWAWQGHVSHVEMGLTVAGERRMDDTSMRSAPLLSVCEIDTGAMYHSFACSAVLWAPGLASCSRKLTCMPSLHYRLPEARRLIHGSAACLVSHPLHFWQPNMHVCLSNGLCSMAACMQQGWAKNSLHASHTVHVDKYTHNQQATTLAGHPTEHSAGPMIVV